MFEVRLPKESKKVHVLPLTMIGPAEPGTVTEEFTMTIGGVADPVTFKVFGKVVGVAGAPPAAVQRSP